MPSTQPWEEEFDKKNFKYYDTYNNDFKNINDYPLSDDIKSFISQLLISERAKLLKEIEEKIDESPLCLRDYNRIKSLLNSLK